MAELIQVWGDESKIVWVHVDLYCKHFFFGWIPSIEKEARRIIFWKILESGGDIIHHRLRTNKEREPCEHGGRHPQGGVIKLWIFFRTRPTLTPSTPPPQHPSHPTRGIYKLCFARLRRKKYQRWQWRFNHNYDGPYMIYSRKGIPRAETCKREQNGYLTPKISFCDVRKSNPKSSMGELDSV